MTRRPTRTWVRDECHHVFGPHAQIPDAPEGQVRLEQVYSHPPVAA